MTCPYTNPTVKQCMNCPFSDCVRDEKQDINERARLWRKNNPEKQRVIRRRYYLKHAEQEKLYQKQTYQLIKDLPEYKSHKKKLNKDYRNKNLDRLRQKDREYYLANREKRLKYAAEYRARKKAERVS